MKKFITLLVALISLVSPIAHVSAHSTDMTGKHPSEIKNALEEAYEGYWVPVDVLTESEDSVVSAIDEYMSEYLTTVVMEDDIYNIDNITIKYILMVPNEELTTIPVLARLGDSESLNAWDSGIVESFVSISGTIARGTPRDHHYIVMMLNPTNIDNFIFVAYDGEVYYDIVNEDDKMDDLVSDIIKNSDK